jgi:transposase
MTPTARCGRCRIFVLWYVSISTGAGKAVATGYERLFELRGSPDGCLVALEATGHYWRNLLVALIAKSYVVAVLNPLRTARFAEEELRRTKTGAIDALGIARFAQQKRPRTTQLPDAPIEELRELSGCAKDLRRTSPAV